MTTTKTLLLAGFIALSVGTGAAMAQDGGQAYPDWQGARAVSAAHVRTTQNAQPIPLTSEPAGQVQSGSSDVDQNEIGADHTATFILNHHLFGAGGVSG